MVRTTSYRTQLHSLGSYRQRSSVYHQASARDVETILQEIKRMTGVPETAITFDESDITLPPKLPTPDVILRSDIMPKQRSHTVL